MRRTIAALVAVATAATLAVAAPAGPVGAGPRPTLRIMPLGDSITYGSGSTYRSGYRGPLVGALRAVDARFVTVGSVVGGPGPYGRHEGHPGWTVAGILYGNGRPGTGIAAWCAAFRPDVVLLHIGTNDVRDHTRTPPAVMAWRLAEILRRIRACNPAARVLVARPIVARAVRAPAAAVQRWNARLAAYDRFIPGVVARAGGRVHLVDMRYATGPDGMADALHPNNLGYQRMTARWYAALRLHKPGMARWGAR